MTDDQHIENVIKATHIAADNLQHWTIELMALHDDAKKNMSHEDDYQNGYLHGLNTAIEHMRSKLPEIEQYRVEMYKMLRGTDDQKPNQ